MLCGVEKGVVDRFLQEHRFSDINHCRRASRWPLSRQCCPLSVAAVRGDVLVVTLLLKQGADPEACGPWDGPCWKSVGQDGRQLVERAAADIGRRLATQSGAFWSIFHVVDTTGLEWEQPLFRDLRRDDPLLRQPAQAA